MAKHTVTFTLPEREVKRADIRFKVKQDGVLFGTLEVSNGALEWRPKSKQTSIPITWEAFDAFARGKRG